MESTERVKEREIAPQLPTSGQVLGAVVKALNINDGRLRSKTVRRYFSGRLKDRVKDSSRAKIFDAISDALPDVGLGPLHRTENESSPSLASILDWHARNWDELRAFLLPRMASVYPRHLASVRLAYIRLAAIDLALRTGAHLHFAGASSGTLDFLGWISSDRRGYHLNGMRSEAGLSLRNFAEVVGVSDNTVEAWMYNGVRPSDDNLVKIAKGLGREAKPSERRRILRELRRFYWSSDVVALIGELIGMEAADDIVRRFRQYASQVQRIIDAETTTKTGQNELVDIAILGARSTFSMPLLAALTVLEPDEEWKEDIWAVGSDWIRRVLTVNLEVDLAEVDALIDETDGQILKDWDVSEPRAYDHYRRSLELQAQGKIHEAVAEVAKAAELDPLDPVNHFSLGSAKGWIGANTGNKALVEEALNSCWMAVTLDPNWILPWTEIGWLLLRMDKASEAVEHLKSVRPECGPLDSRYYDALGMALDQMGKFAEALTALETSLELKPDNPHIALTAAAVAWQAGDKNKYNQYRKDARHLGIPGELDMMLELTKEIQTHLPPSDIEKNPDKEIEVLDAYIARNPDDAIAYFARARSHFTKRDDVRAISDLDAAIGLDPRNANFYLFRGIVYGYMERFDRAIVDLSEAIRLSPDNEMAHYYRGLAYGEQDAFDLAISDFNEVIRLNPEHSDAYWGRGDCYRYQSEYDRAISDFDTALQINPEDFASYRSRGAAYRMKLEFDKAIDDYDTALRLDPDDQFANRFRGDAYLAMGDYERAIADFNTALNIKGDDEVAYRGRGSAHLFRGELDLAIADFNTAIDCNPESADAIYGRGVARELMGDTKGAESDYRWARALGYEEKKRLIDKCCA